MSKTSHDYITQMIEKLEYAQTCFNSGSFIAEGNILKDCEVLLDRAIALNGAEQISKYSGI